MIWLTIVLIGIITYAYRMSFILLLDKIHVPPLIERALRFVPIAALMAIITPELLINNGAIDLSVLNARLIAGLIAAAVAWRTRNLFATLVIGMATLWVLQRVLA